MRFLMASLVIAMCMGAVSERDPLRAEVLGVSNAGNGTPLGTGLANKGSRSETVRKAIRSVFGKHSSAAIRVAKCESGLNPKAVSRTGDVGLYQVNFSAHHWPGESFAAFKRRMFDVGRNVRYAHRLSRGGTDFHRHWKWSEHCWGRS